MDTIFSNGQNPTMFRYVFFTVPFFKNYNFFAVRIFLGPELHYPGNPWYLGKQHLFREQVGNWSGLDRMSSSPESICI